MPSRFFRRYASSFHFRMMVIEFGFVLVHFLIRSLEDIHVAVVRAGHIACHAGCEDDLARELTVRFGVVSHSLPESADHFAAEIGKLVHEKSPKALFHVDAIQAFGKYRIYPKKLGIDLLSVSSHKIHGPKGVGFLYINEKVRVQPQILGGGQQNGMRSGTDNVPGIAGLGVAAEMVYTDFDKKIQHLYDLKERMAEGLSKLGDITINGMPLREGAPHIMSVTFHGVRSEVLLHTLEEFGVYISAGSACSSHKRKPSATLTAMGLSRADVESTVRISFCEENTFEEVDYCLEALGKTIPMLRRYARR